MMLTIFLTIEDSNERDFITDLYEKNSPRLLGAADHLLHNYHDAEDAVQEVFIKLIPRIPLLQKMPVSDQRAFLTVCVLNQARDILRTRKARKEVELTEEIEDPDAEDHWRSFDQSDVILRFLNTRKETERQAFVFHFHLGLRYREIAACLHMTEGAVQKMIARLKKDLKLYWEEQVDKL